MHKKKNNSIFSSHLFFHKVLNQAGPAANASYSLIASIFLFIIGGLYVDNYLDISPAGAIIGMFWGSLLVFIRWSNFQIIKKIALQNNFFVKCFLNLIFLNGLTRFYHFKMVLF